MHLFRPKTNWISLTEQETSSSSTLYNFRLIFSFGECWNQTTIKCWPTIPSSHFYCLIVTSTLISCSLKRENTEQTWVQLIGAALHDSVSHVALWEIKHTWLCVCSEQRKLTGDTVEPFETSLPANFMDTVDAVSALWGKCYHLLAYCWKCSWNHWWGS